MSVTAPPTKRRADAAHNRALLLEAAEEVFSEQGMQAPLEAISARAGLGRATLFRNFSDRHTLIMALLERGLDHFQAEATRVAGSPDELVQLLRFILEKMALRAPLIEYWQSFGRQRPEIQAGIARAIDIATPAISRTVAAGGCRADLVPSDVLPLLALFSGSLCGCSAQDRDVLAARAWTFAMDIVQPAGAAAGSTT